jgi:hypothetical protein
MEVPARKIRIGEAAAAIGTTPKALEHWISRYGDRGLKPTAEQTGRWREFSWGDVAALAITKYLVDIGIPAFDAFERSLATVQHYFPKLFDPFPELVLRAELTPFILGRDRDAYWLDNVPEANLPLRVLIDVDFIIDEAFTALRDMGHELKVDDAQRPHLSVRQRIVAARVRQLQTFEPAKEYEQAWQDITKQIEATTNPDERKWMLAQLQTLSDQTIKPDTAREKAKTKG